MQSLNTGVWVNDHLADEGVSPDAAVALGDLRQGLLGHRRIENPVERTPLILREDIRNTRPFV